MAESESMILDTCALLWLAAGTKISRAILKKIEDAPAIYVSAISAFEISLKTAKGKLRLSRPAREWFERAIEHHGLTVLPLDFEICVSAAQLPPIHDDPCDRFIIATARLNKLKVITADKRFAEYDIDVLW